MESFKEYKNYVLETKVYPDKVAIPYVALGLGGEAGEFYEKINMQAPREDIAKEAGDVLWYCAALDVELNLGIESWPTIADEESTSPFNFQIPIGAIQEQVKKYLRDEWKEDEQVKFPEIRRQAVRVAVEAILKSLSIISRNVLNRSIGELAQQNREKLNKRMKEGKIHGSGDDR